MKNLSSNKLNILLLILAVIATMFTIVFGTHIQQGFDISIGDVSPRTFIATRQVENRIATERLRDEARATVITIIIQDWEVEEQIRENLTTLFENVNILRQIEDLETPQEENVTQAEMELQQYQLPYQNGQPYLFSLPQNSEIISDSPALSSLTQEQLEILIFSNQPLFNHFQSTVFEIFSILINQGISEHNPNWEQEIYSLMALRGIPYPLNAIGFIILRTYIVPNNLEDEEATNALREEMAQEVEPIIFLQSQNIVNEGEIVTEEIYYALVDLGYVTEGYTINFIPILGSSIIVLILFGITVYYIYLFVPANFKNKKYSLLLFTLYMIVILAASILHNSPHVFIPILIFTMLVGMLINYKLAIIANLCITIITFIITEGDISFLLYFIITGNVVAIITRYALERNKTIIFSLFVSVISAVVSISVSLLLDRTLTMDILFTIAYGFFAGFFAVIICVGTLPLWESFFGVITPIKLLDLTNPSNLLLRRLSIEAPGTYHHSIIVANLSEAAAYDINADTVLARVGAYFHDIGKLRNPSFFIENQVGQNIHDEIQPIESAEIIIDHTIHGQELADENNLPLILKDIIQQHHGTTLLKYFYEKEKKLLQEKSNNEDQVNIDTFKYKGPIPQFKESAIVMLADTVEAAVRSMISKLKTKEEIKSFVSKLIEDKLMEGQLTDSDLTIKDLQTIEKAFLRVFNGMYHERIPYPPKNITTK